MESAIKAVYLNTVYLNGWLHYNTVTNGFVYPPIIIMRFKQEELIARETEIAKYLVQGYSLKQVSEKMGIRKK